MTKDVSNIWLEFHKELKGFIVNKVCNQADSDDLLQEVFIKIIHHQDKVSQAKNMRNYLYGIVRNAISDHFRKKREAYEDLDGIPEPLSLEDEQSLNEAIAACCLKPFIDKLPEKYRDSLIMFEFQGMSLKDIAEKLNISLSGAKSRVQRGRIKLRELIIECCAYEADVYGNLRVREKESCS
ncbi:MAG: RNA polymerase sigma factor SigZ [Saprospiraceae bacterium]|nr:MAG: RNA polymerase sigma factor SigZ [Saprospiraceae bacterium]